MIQRVVQEAPPKPSADAGVGHYDVNVEYMTDAEAYHTIEERVQRIREKEIQSWVDGRFSLGCGMHSGVDACC